MDVQPQVRSLYRLVLLYFHKTHSLDSLVRSTRATMLLFVGKTRSFCEKWWTVTQFKMVPVENFPADNLI